MSGEGIGKQYGDRTIFENVVFDIQKEERIAITGPNGSGKSTLIKVLTGQEQADSGEVTLGEGALATPTSIRCGRNSILRIPLAMR